MCERCGQSEEERPYLIITRLVAMDLPDIPGAEEARAIHDGLQRIAFEKGARFALARPEATRALLRMLDEVRDAEMLLMVAEWLADAEQVATDERL